MHKGGNEKKGSVIIYNKIFSHSLSNMSKQPKHCFTIHFTAYYIIEHKNGIRKQINVIKKQFINKKVTAMKVLV